MYNNGYYINTTEPPIYYDGWLEIFYHIKLEGYGW